MREFGLDGFEDARPHELSGGMRQRVAFLRTLLAGKPVLCLDEPFASLDALTRQEMGDWLSDALTHEPRTALLVTHDVEEASCWPTASSCSRRARRRVRGTSTSTCRGRDAAPIRCSSSAAPKR